MAPEPPPPPTPAPPPWRPSPARPADRRFLRWSPPTLPARPEQSCARTPSEPTDPWIHEPPPPAAPPTVAIGRPGPVAAPPPPSAVRRPGLYLGVAAAGALLVDVLIGVDPAAQAEAGTP